ncbi:MAG: BglG family transcription antiterminator [Anaerocolumna sp.]
MIVKGVRELNTIYLNVRCKEILQMLLNSDSYLSLQQIANDLKVSQRSIYYDLCRINEWLVDNEIPELEMVRGKGLFLPEEIRQRIEDCTDDREAEDVYIYSPMERIQIIICGIIYFSTPVHIDKLTDYCKVSRNTIFNDLRVVVNQLQKYDLKLEYRSKKGYIVTGDAIKVRAVFLLNFKGLQNLFTNNGLRFVDQEKMNRYEDILKQVEKELGIEYVPENRRSLAVLLPMMERGNENLNFADLKKQEMESCKEYKLVEKYFPHFSEKEKIYLCLHLLGGRLATSSEDIFENTANEMVYEITKALVSEFEKVACVSFDRREELERQLFVHINSSMYRYRYGTQNLDSLNEDIIREYPDLFEITRIVSRYLEKQIGLPIPDSEVAYLALHFGAYLPISNNKSEKIRVLIVCANGISTGNMLKREITKMFPEVEVVGIESATKVLNAQAACELIVSTVKLKSVVPVIQVHPILTGRDKELLVRHLKLNNNTGYVNLNEIFSIVKPYIAEENYGKVQKLIEEYLYDGKSGYYIDSNNHKKGLLSVMDAHKIEIHNDKYKWPQALWMAGEYLMDLNSIQSVYIDSIISQLRYYGPYMFIAPRVILAHSKPEMGVNKLDCSMHVFRNPVEFSEKDKANVVIVLAAKDQESHLKILHDIMTIFEEDETLDALLEKNNSYEILKYFQKILDHKRKEEETE